MSDNPFDIDPMALDAEWIRQPKLYADYAEAAEAAENEVRIAEAKYDVMLNEVCLDIRNNPSAYGLAKVTDPTVKQAATCDARVKAKVKAIVAAKAKLGKLKAGCRALEHKKRALEKLVDLLLNNYYADPRQHTPGGTGDMDRRGVANTTAITRE